MFRLYDDFSPIISAAIWMLGTLLSFALMAIGARELSDQLGTFQILFFRSLIGITILLVLSRTGVSVPWRSTVPGLHVLRNLAHYAGQFAWFYAIAFIPLADVFALEFTVPLWTALMALLILGERLTGARILALILGVIGMLVILRPGLELIHPAALVMLVGAACYGISHTLTKKLAQTQAPLTIVFYMTAIQLPLGLLPALYAWKPLETTQFPWLIVVGVTALTAHYCMSRALSLADATVVVTMDFLRLPLIALVGYLFYEEILDWFSLLGALIMLAGNYVNIRAQGRYNPAQITNS